MNQQLKEILDDYEEADAKNKQLIKMKYYDEISKWDVADWEKETGRKSTW